jgi:membrane associated rhomboid family serine protease
MLPLTDHNPRRTFPIVNLFLVAANILVFLWEMSLGARLGPVLETIAFVPRTFWVDGFWTDDARRILTSMFLHGGFLHVGGNMLYLWIFGDNIEDRLGHGRYLMFYLLCGFLATLGHAFFNPESVVPAIGASGAIAGVLGAYIVLFPRARVTTLIPIFFFITVREIPAVVLLGFWFVLQLFSGVGSLGAAGAESAGGVAWFAHIGGFVAGMALVFLFGGGRRRGLRPVA